MLILSFLSWLSLFMIISLTSLLGRLLISTLLFFSFRVLSCSFFWNTFLTFLFLYFYVFGINNLIYANAAAAAAAKSLQSCLTLCDPIDGSPPSSPVPGILQARILEWVAISSSNEWKWKVKVKSLSHAQLLATPWTAAYQAPPPMGVFRQEYWSGVPLPSPYMQMIPL